MNCLLRVLGNMFMFLCDWYSYCVFLCVFYLVMFV